MRLFYRAALLAMLPIAPLAAQTPAQDTSAIRRLERQVDAITRELEALRLGRDVVVVADTGQHGFGPAASKVYRAKSGVSLGGYGEFFYQNFAGERQDGAASGQRDEIDALRAVLYAGYKFNDRVLFNSEIEFEHGGEEVGVEFAYLEYRPSPRLGLRAGLLLVPLGFINERHEPPVYLGTTRPETERAIIPTTWREVGVGLFGEIGDLTWRAYLVNGFDAAGFSASGLRDGRQNGSEATAESFAAAGRLDYTVRPGLTVGSGLYFGHSGQGVANPGAPGEALKARTTVWEAHAEYQARGWDLRGLVAGAWLDQADQVNAANGLAGAASVGSRLAGWYLQAGYDVLRHTAAGQALVPYVRYEQLNTQQRVPTGFSANPANDRQILSVGAMWKPLPAIAVKADYQVRRNEADTGVNQLNLNLGYLF